MVYPNQMRGTVVNYANRPTDFRVDPFGSPTSVVAVSDGVTGGGLFVPSSAADDVRDIERDAFGRVLKIVHGRNIPETADSVMYQYDGLGRVVQMIRNTAQNPLGTRVSDTVGFTYDSLSLATNAAWCSRLKSMQDPMSGTTTIGYGTSGVARCLPSRSIGLASDTTLFTYGPLTAGDRAGVRPVKVRDPNGIADSVAYEAGAWNSGVHIRQTDGATGRAYYDRFGRADSIVDPVGTVTRFRRDRYGRATHQKAGNGLLAPTVRTTYDAGGLATQADVYASADGDLTLPTGSIQSTRSYYDRLGQLDSIVGPGVRTPADKSARKQSFLRDRYGIPTYEYSGNGSYLGRVTDWQGRVKSLEQSYVDPTHSLGDGERFAAPADLAAYANFFLASGPHLSTGQFYEHVYDSKGRRTALVGRENYLGILTDRRWGYSRPGAVIADTLTFQDGATVIRRYEYNQRGQRTAARTAITLTSGSLGTEATDSTRYYYNGATARMDSLKSWSGSGLIGRVRMTYDRGGRQTLQAVALGGMPVGEEVVTSIQYDASGRQSFLETKNSSTLNGGQLWYRFGSPVYDGIDELRSAVTREPGITTDKQYTYEYSTDGTRRLTRTQTVDFATNVNVWSYDLVGNRITELATSTSSSACSGTVPLDYDPANRLQVRHSHVSCNDLRRYWNDQAGNRLGETDSLGGVTGTKAQMTYTSAGQLYYSLTPTAAAGTYDYNWHWYDGDGLRVISQTDKGTSIVAPRPDSARGTRLYYVYDGSDVALVLAKRAGGAWFVRQRVLSGGVDAVLAGRYSAAGTVFQNLALVSDRQGSTLAAVRPDGLEELSAIYPGRNAFGWQAGATTSGAEATTNTETGFSGASTPNQTGGFTYLRNRWYDPATGRFLSQDPIGLAGGVNLYAYAGNNPVAYTDPFGLCTPPDSPICRFILGVAQRVQPLQNFVEDDVGEFTGINDLGRAAEHGANSEYAAAAGALIFAAANVVPEGAAGLKVAANLRRTVKGAQGADVTVTTLGRWVKATWEVAGEGGGQSRALWTKYISRDGKTVRLIKDSYDRAGRFMHRKVKNIRE